MGPPKHVARLRRTQLLLPAALPPYQRGRCNPPLQAAVVSGARAVETAPEQVGWGHGWQAHNLGQRWGHNWQNNWGQKWGHNWGERWAAHWAEKGAAPEQKSATVSGPRQDKPAVLPTTPGAVLVSAVSGP
jgi:hypothetical protein